MFILPCFERRLLVRKLSKRCSLHWPYSGFAGCLVPPGSCALIFDNRVVMPCSYQPEILPCTIDQWAVNPSCTAHSTVGNQHWQLAHVILNFVVISQIDKRISFCNTVVYH